MRVKHFKHKYATGEVHRHLVLLIDLIEKLGIYEYSSVFRRQLCIERAASNFTQRANLAAWALDPEWA